ncbi:MAG: ATPase domain-containing protein [Candidatus Diapherotrites archaeon]
MGLERTKTGIAGLDSILEGGFPKSSSVLISGGSGTGKTIMCTQYLYNGAKDYNEPGVYVTLENNVKNITWNMESFNWDIKKFQDQNLIKIYRFNVRNVTTGPSVDSRMRLELEHISKLVEEIGAKRLVVDSTTSLGLWLSGGSLRLMLYEFTDALMDLGCTTLLTTETKDKRNQFSAFGVEEFISDGIIALYFTPPNRSIFIRKMRGTDHSKSIHPLTINKNGITVNSKEQILWESLE